MQIYLVGGAVRDKLLGLHVKERDWVVVGATPNEMIKKGFKSVGKDFPVFLHPETKEEYALARTERKVGLGYTGFEFNTSPDVTLKEDLMRRDLTINAMAEDSDGKLIDYYGGKEDLENRLLRHVSPAFAEDPVRILRIARFAARYAQYGFTVAPETITLMKQMVDNGEVDALVPERVWKELERALGEKNPDLFFQVLAECNALPRLFPELLENPFAHLINAVEKTDDKTIRFSALLSDVPKPLIEKLCDRYRVPTQYRELALNRIENASIEPSRDEQAEEQFLHSWPENHIQNLRITSDDYNQTAERILRVLAKLDAFRRGERFLKILETAEILKNENVALLKKCYDEAKKITAEQFISEGLSGKQIGERIHAKRREIISEIIHQWENLQNRSN